MLACNCLYKECTPSYWVYLGDIVVMAWVVEQSYSYLSSLARSDGLADNSSLTTALLYTDASSTSD